MKLLTNESGFSLRTGDWVFTPATMYTLTTLTVKVYVIYFHRKIEEIIPKEIPKCFSPHLLVFTWQLIIVTAVNKFMLNYIN